MIIKTYVNPLIMSGTLVKVKLRQGGSFYFFCTNATEDMLHGFDKDYMDVSIGLEDIESLQEVNL